jgi:hypothetical protein
VTLLAQDDSGGLQVAAPAGAGRDWIDAPPIPGTLVCNIGDMLDRLTGGWYRSTPHRVRNLSGHGRLSFPFFLDPGFDAEVPPLPDRAAAATTLATTSRVADLMWSMAAEAVTSVAPISPSRARRATVRPNRGATTRSKSLSRGARCGAQRVALHAGTVVAVNIAITRFFVENEATG